MKTLWKTWRRLHRVTGVVANDGTGWLLIINFFLLQLVLLAIRMLLLTWAWAACLITDAFFLIDIMLTASLQPIELWLVSLEWSSSNHRTHIRRRSICTIPRCTWTTVRRANNYFVCNILAIWLTRSLKIAPSIKSKINRTPPSPEARSIITLILTNLSKWDISITTIARKIDVLTFYQFLNRVQSIEFDFYGLDEHIVQVEQVVAYSLGQRKVPLKYVIF